MEGAEQKTKVKGLNIQHPVHTVKYEEALILISDSRS